MQVRIPLRKSLINFLLARGSKEPYVYSSKDIFSFTIFHQLRCKASGDPRVNPRADECLFTIQLPNEWVKNNRRYISRQSIDHVNDVLIEHIKEYFIQELHVHCTQPNLKMIQGIELLRAKYELTDEDFAFDAIKKRFYRYRKSLEKAAS